MRKNYEQGHYIAAAVEDGEDYNFTEEEPSPLILISEDDKDADISAAAKSIDETAKIKYNVKMENHNKKIEQFTQNKFKASAFIWEKCSTMMRQSIESKEDCDKIKRNPYKLFEAIKSLSYNYQESNVE